MIKKKKTEYQDVYPWDFQDICDKIDNIASRLAKEIIKYEPLDLLHRAFWINVSKNIKNLSDHHSEHDRFLSSQTLEFIQNYLVSLEPVQGKQLTLNDKRWKKIENLVDNFNNYMISFFILGSKDLQNQSEQNDIDRDSLRTLDTMHWWSVRGNRYHVHQISQVRELLLPQKHLFEETSSYLTVGSIQML